MKNLNKNIKINYFYHFFLNVNVTQGIWMIYLVSKGLNLFEVGLLEGIFHMSSFLMETPTGAVADLYGKKTSRIVGRIIGLVSGILMIVSNSFWGFALSFIFSALSYNFESGAGEALIYDSLKAEGKEEQFIKLTGHYETIFQGAGIIALIAGGYIGTLTYMWVFYISIVITLISLVIGFFFEEPPMVKKEKSTPFIEAIKAQYVDSFQIIRTKKKLSYLIIFSSLLSLIITLSFFYLQVRWKSYGYSELQIGLILSLSSASAIIGALIAEKADKKYGELSLLKIIPFIIGGTVLSLSSISFSIVGFSVACFIECLLFVALRDYINRIIPSDKRATIISFESTCFSFFMILIFPIFGYLADKITMGVTFLILGSLMILLSIVNLKVLGNGISKEKLIQEKQ